MTRRLLEIFGWFSPFLSKYRIPPIEDVLMALIGENVMVWYLNETVYKISNRP